MAGLVETLVNNQSPPPLLTDAEHAKVLRARRRANDVAANPRAAGGVAVAPDGDSDRDPVLEALDSRRRKKASP